MDSIITIILLGIIALQTTYLVASQVLKIARRAQKLIFVDTSVLIDGRIIAIAESGFVSGTLAIPRSVVGELQFLADNGDSDKRTRARHGLDIIKQLQAMSTVQTVIFADSTRADEGVDNRLLSLAKRYHGSVCTIDYNLNKVAQVEGLVVLNVNELAKSLRMAYLPGEKIQLELTQKGNDSHQAVGHLSDGTMVVVEHAHQHIGKTVEVEFIRSLQTAAGKMMFAKLVGQKQAQQQPQKPQSQKQQSQKQVAPRAQAAKQSKPAGRKPQIQQATAPQDKQQPQSRQDRQQKPRRRRTPEDSLVELANR